MKCVLVNCEIYKVETPPLYEMENLLSTLKIDIDFVATQKLEKISTSSFIGSGFLNEIAQFVKQNDIDVLVFNHDLSPLQIHNISEVCDILVYDRSMIILKIFELRASSKEAKLQVEVAYLKYMASRLIEKDKNYSQVTSGGAGGLTNRGAGEKAIDIKRYLLKRRIKEKEEELDKVVKLRKNQRQGRSKTLPTVAIVGYTNAGKSTLMNHFIRKTENVRKDEILQENRLFATLSTNTRYVKIDGYYPFLLTDTVGFISHLPHSLIKAFRSTLEEIKEADLLVHVVDISSPSHFEEMKVTNETLKEIGVDNKNVIYLYNKYDQLVDNFKPFVGNDELLTCLNDDEDFEDIIKLIDSKLSSFYVEVSMLIPYENASDYYEIKNNEAILETKETEFGYDCIAKISKSNYKKYSKYLMLKKDLDE